VRADTGKRDRYASMIPRQRAVIPRLRRREDRTDAPDDVELAHFVNRRREGSFARKVRHEDEARFFTLSLLLHRLDGNFVLAEHARDRREHAGLVGGVERHVELRSGFVDRPDAAANERADSRAPCAGTDILRGVDEISEDRTRRGTAARTAAEQHQLTNRLALDEDRVVRAAH